MLVYIHYARTSLFELLFVLLFFLASMAATSAWGKCFEYYKEMFRTNEIKRIILFNNLDVIVRFKKPLNTELAIYKNNHYNCFIENHILNGDPDLFNIMYRL